MDYGALNGYFDGAVAKTLAAVDISPAKSNQHEFNGTGPLRALFGDDDIKGMPTTFAYLEDDADPSSTTGSPRGTTPGAGTRPGLSTASTTTTTSA